MECGLAISCDIPVVPRCCCSGRSMRSAVVGVCFAFTKTPRNQDTPQQATHESPWDHHDGLPQILAGFRSMGPHVGFQRTGKMLDLKHRRSQRFKGGIYNECKATRMLQNQCQEVSELCTAEQKSRVPRNAFDGAPCGSLNRFSFRIRAPECVPHVCPKAQLSQQELPPHRPLASSFVLLLPANY